MYLGQFGPGIEYIKNEEVRRVALQAENYFKYNSSYFSPDARESFRLRIMELLQESFALPDIPDPGSLLVLISNFESLLMEMRASPKMSPPPGRPPPGEPPPGEPPPEHPPGVAPTEKKLSPVLLIGIAAVAFLLLKEK